MGPFEALPTAYELTLLLTKQRYHYLDLDALRPPQGRSRAAGDDGVKDDVWGIENLLVISSPRRHDAPRTDRFGSCGGRSAGSDDGRHCTARRSSGQRASATHRSGIQPDDVWDLPARQAPHTMPIEVPLRCIAAGCPPSGTVLDMFAGTAATGVAAHRLGRTFIGVESNAGHCRIAERRLRQDTTGDGR